MSGEQGRGCPERPTSFLEPTLLGPLSSCFCIPRLRGEAAGMLGGRARPRRNRCRAQGCRGSEQRRSRWEVPRPRGEAEPIRGEAASWGRLWRSQPHPNHSFFSRLAHALPPALAPAFPSPSKYLPGQRTPHAGSRWINFLEHQNRLFCLPAALRIWGASLLFKKGNVALPKI